MLEFEIAALYYFIMSLIEANPYFDEVPEDVLTPCVFFPSPEADGDTFSTSAYGTDFVLYIKFMDSDTSRASIMASQVLQGILGNKKKIPLRDEKGKLTGKNFKVKKASARKIDVGVYQMEITWTRYSRYNAKAVTLAKEFFMNGEPMNE